METTNYRYNDGEFRIRVTHWTDGMISAKCVVWCPNGKQFSEAFESEAAAKEWAKGKINDNRK